MKYVHETWYILADGTQADPNDVAPDDKGVLRHKSGLAVATHADGTPMSAGRAAIDNKNVEAAKLTKPKAELLPEAVLEEPALEAKETKPEVHKGGYKTRETKAN